MIMVLKNRREYNFFHLQSLQRKKVTKRIWLDFPDSASLRDPFWVQASMSCIQLRFHTVSPSWWHYTPPSQSKVVVSKAEYGRYLRDVGVSKNRGFSQNGWFLNNGKPLLNGWFGGKPIYFRKHPWWVHDGFMDNPKTGAGLNLCRWCWRLGELRRLRRANQEARSAPCFWGAGWHLETTQEGPMDGEMHLKDLKGPRKLIYCSNLFSHSTPLRTLAWIISNQSIWG